MSKGRTPWVKTRHKLIQNLFSGVAYPYVCHKYHIEIKRFRESQSRPMLVVFNHQTGYDQFFATFAVDKPLYFIASEDIFSMGWLSRLITWLVAPIPIKKQTSDLRAVRNALQIAKEGGSIALAPEGNRTFDGKLCYINPAILGLIRLVKLPVATLRIEGGFGVQPRWSDVIRKGPMKAYVSRVIEPEEYRRLSDEDLMNLLLSEINVDETLIKEEYHSPHLAEYMERAIYVCPECGLSRFESHGDLMECKQCGLTVRYLPDKTFAPVSEHNFPFETVADWYEYQGNFIRGLNPEDYYHEPAYEDTGRFSEVILYDSKKVISENAAFRLYGNRLDVAAGDFTAHWHFDQVDTITVLGKNKINIYVEDKVYQIKSDARFNALKYVNFFYHYKGIEKGDSDGKQFLGL